MMQLACVGVRGFRCCCLDPHSPLSRPPGKTNENKSISIARTTKLPPNNNNNTALDRMEQPQDGRVERSIRVVISESTRLNKYLYLPDLTNFILPIRRDSGRFIREPPVHKTYRAIRPPFFVSTLM